MVGSGTRRAGGCRRFAYSMSVIRTGIVQSETEPEVAVRVTQRVMEELLKLNDGFEWTTSYKGGNFRETRVYKIVDGMIQVTARGKTSWADSRYSETYTLDRDEARRALKSVMGVLRKDGLE